MGASIVVVFLIVASSDWAQAAATQERALRPQHRDVFRQSLQELVSYLLLNPLLQCFDDRSEDLGFG